MKVAIGSKYIDKPWGGGNLFIKNLTEYLVQNNVETVLHLGHKDIDTILLFDPRKDSKYATFNHEDINYYKKYVNENVKVVHRINECDERKNTTGVNKFYINANKCADHTVFVSEWLQKIYLNQDFNNNNSVIKAGANRDIFNTKNRSNLNDSNYIKIVTHHWGNNWNKGFETYKLIDELVGTEINGKKIKFSYIGNLPKNFRFENTEHISPLSGEDLAKELKKYHIYVTGSLNEPSGNHHIEAAQCGLPLLYINSGGIPEYCDGFGVPFEEYNFVEKLNKIINKYDYFFEKILEYENNSEKMSQEFLELFNDLNGSFRPKKLKISNYYFLNKQKAKYYLI